MVLWEITLATAYFLGLKRTYRLALRIQRRIISPRYPRLRNVIHGRTRNVFDIALTVHRNIQKKDIELGKSIGNRILRFLDRMKPSANIRGDASIKDTHSGIEGVERRSCNYANSVTKKLSKSDKEAGKRHLFTSVPTLKSDSHYLSQVASFRQCTGQGLLSGIGMKSSLISPSYICWSLLGQKNHQCRNVSSLTMVPRLSLISNSRGVFREDIAVWMKQ